MRIGWPDKYSLKVCPVPLCQTKKHTAELVKVATALLAAGIERWGSTSLVEEVSHTLAHAKDIIAMAIGAAITKLPNNEISVRYLMNHIKQHLHEHNNWRAPLRASH